MRKSRIYVVTEEARLDFEWDDEKASANVAKHGVSFEAAKAVFGDPNALVESDQSDEEERWRTIGMAAASLLFVVYVERYLLSATGPNQDEPVIRIISARRATRNEQSRYDRQALP